MQEQPQEQKLIDLLVLQRQQIQQAGATITGLRIHPDDLQAIENIDAGSQVIDLMEATMFGVPYTETTEVEPGDPEFTTDADVRA